MKRLWAPWRMEYIRGPKATGCVFCDLNRSDRDRENLVLYRGQLCFVLLNRYPYTNGHLMVAPIEHTDTPEVLPSAVLLEMMELVNLCIRVLKRTMAPEGCNIGMNVGSAAGAGIKDHIHMHIVPRWTGDTNYMPVFADTRVIVESLYDTYDQLKPVFDQLTASQSPQ